MKATREALEERIRLALDDADLQADPLREPLAELWEAHQDMARRIDRISRISDAYQSEAKRNETSLAERLNKQLRQLEKVARISDHYQKIMHDLNLALREASTHDPLTNLPNRRLLLERLREEAERFRRYRHPFIIAMLDIDHFKQVNDRWGHEVGDHVLTEVARVLRAEIRDQDLCGRWGGEEFLILLPETPMATADVVMERVRAAVERLNVRVHDESVGVTVSIGVAEHRLDDTYSDTINHADAALLLAKRQGRNRFEKAGHTQVD